MKLSSIAAIFLFIAAFITLILLFVSVGQTVSPSMPVKNPIAATVPNKPAIQPKKDIVLFDKDYQLPTDTRGAEKDEKYYRGEVSMSEFQLPSLLVDCREDEINAARHAIYRYYLAKYAWQKKSLDLPGMRNLINQTAELLIYPYSSDPGAVIIAAEQINPNKNNELLVDLCKTLARSCRFDSIDNMKKLRAEMRSTMLRLSRDPDCPPLTVFYYCSGFARFHARQNTAFPDKIIGKTAAVAMVKAFKNEDLRPWHFQTAFRMIESSGLTMVFADIADQLVTLTDIPDDLRELLLGAAAVDNAWEHTPKAGGFYSEQEFATFQQYMQTARIHFERSYTLNPFAPEAAAAMIVVETGLYSHTTPTVKANKDPRILWFNRAVKAQNDYLAAYRNMIWSLFARKLQFRNLALPYDNKMDNALQTAVKNSYLYNTDVPLIYAEILEFQATASPSLSWRTKFCAINTISDIAEIIAGFQRFELTKERKIHIKAIETIFNTYAGHYSEAHTTMKELSESVKQFQLSWFNARQIIEAPGWQLIAAEINYGVSPDKALLEEINAGTLIDDGKYNPAGDIINILKKYPANANEFNFLRKRLAECDDTSPLWHEWISSDPLHVALRLGNEQSVEQLLKLGVTPPQTDESGIMTLQSYILTGWTPGIVEMLIKAGCDPDAADSSYHNFTPLQTALTYHRKELIPVLLRYVKDINRRGNNSLSALDTAIHKSDIPTMEAIIAKGAKINQCDNDGWSPLYRAVYIQRQDIVKMLLKHGADINLKDHRGKTPMDIAKSEAMKQFLRNNGGKSGKE